jgi:ribonuclease P protein component
LLPKKERLSRERDIKAVIKSKQFKASSPLLYIVACENDLQLPRLAIVTPRKLGNAVLRNRIRRRLFDVFSDLKPKIVKPVDLLAFPGALAVDNSYLALKKDFLDCLKKCGLC